MFFLVVIFEVKESYNVYNYNIYCFFIKLLNPLKNNFHNYKIIKKNTQSKINYY